MEELNGGIADGVNTGVDVDKGLNEDVGPDIGTKLLDVEVFGIGTGVGVGVGVRFGVKEAPPTCLATGCTPAPAALRASRCLYAVCARR